MNNLSFWKSKTFWLIIRINVAIVGILFLLLTICSQLVLSNYSEKHYRTLSENVTSRMEHQITSLLLELKELGSSIQQEASEEALNDYLRNIVQYSPYIDGGTVLNDSGDVVGYYPEKLRDAGNLLGRDYVQKTIATKAIHFSNIIKTGDREIIVMSVPILENETIDRIVNLSIHLKSNNMFQSIFRGLEIGEGSYAYVIDDKGNILFHPDEEKIGWDTSAQTMTKWALQGQSGYEEITNDQGESFYTSFQHVSGLDWRIITLVPVTSTFIASMEFQHVLFPIFLVLSIGLFLIITYQMHRSLKPFSSLSAALDKMGKGRYPEFIEGTDDRTEIGSIINKFNLMVKELRLHKEDIQQKTKELKQNRNFLKRIINNNPNGIYAMNWSGQYTIVNKEFAQMFHLDPEEVIGKKEEELNPNDPDVLKYLEINREVISTGKEKEMEDYFIDKSGKKRWYHIEKVPIKNGDDEPLVLTVTTDITDRKYQEEVIRHQAYHDDLTMLPNRKLFLERLEQEVQAAKEEEYSFALIFLDLDRFKYINDSFGHDAGDKLLRMAGERLTGLLPDSNTVYRLGGDEFTVLIPRLNNRKEVALLSKDILTELSDPYEMEDYKFISTASIGISIFPNDDTDADSLVKHADIAMYKAKEQGKNTFRFYTSDMETELESKLRLEMDLYQALEKDQLFVQYQPIVSTENGSISGMEALLRWEHPELGLISPAKFIPIAEETGLIHTLGEWVLRNACRHQKELERTGVTPIKIAVNLSPVQLKDRRIIEIVKDVLAETGVKPEYLELEITESTVMENSRKVIKLLKQLRKIGVRIAMDDFGTGYSSLNLLKSLPIDTLKVDRSFVEHLLEKEVEDVILNAVFDIAEKMKLTVIAEGIETDEQYAYLKEKYCHHVQGFLFSQPLADKQFIEYVKGNAA
ncbi:bifunctional diguanylate cyclase/phosphodiesterase [Sediminibacillus massiliensis]|uniref:bifunctional diguanylate cyclase/phosphodiesterase n=1 Tax=Sediminibacillus massiliensis TaxID=1926277 RepID=UPI0015C30AF1|nr:EAL domain-containing protein [Sediminibacillus massiliensis]